MVALGEGAASYEQGTPAETLLELQVQGVGFMVGGVGWAPALLQILVRGLILQTLYSTVRRVLS